MRFGTVMKKFAYRLFGFLFSIFRTFPVNEKKVVFFLLQDPGFSNNLFFIYNKIKEKHPEYTCIIVKRSDEHKVKFWFNYCFHMATAGYIFLNDNFMPMAYMNFSKKTKVVQLWHGVGAFKRFGLSTENRDDVRAITKAGTARLTHLFVSAECVVPCYEEAFGVSRDIIHVTGLPVSDFYFDKSLQDKAVERFYVRYPELKNKKLVLFAPSFRKNDEESAAVIKHFDPARLHELLGNEYIFLIRFHPRFIGEMQTYLSSVCADKCFIDVSNYDDIKDLYCAADVLVTDYSSVIVEYSALMKPSVLFPYDLEEFDRGFYIDYLLTVPGPVARSSEELASEIRRAAEDPSSADTAKIRAFLSHHFEYYDSGSTERVLQVLGL